MKTTHTTIFPARKAWAHIKRKLKEIFARIFEWLTGYDIMFEGSRKDL